MVSVRRTLPLVAVAVAFALFGTGASVATARGHSRKARAARQFAAGAKQVSKVAGNVVANLSATDTARQLRRAYHPYVVVLIAFDHKLGRIGYLYRPAAKDIRRLIDADHVFISALEHPVPVLSHPHNKRLIHAAAAVHAASTQVSRDLGLTR